MLAEVYAQEGGLGRLSRVATSFPRKVVTPAHAEAGIYALG